MTELRLGLAGLGHGETLLGANRSDIPIRVTALCDTNEDKLYTVARERGISNLTTDFHELASRPDIDIVGIYTPGPLHAEQILAALDAGKHIMVTKSMVYTMEEAERVVEAVDKTGLTLLVTQTMRGRYDFMEAKRVCDAGTIGDLFMAEAHYVHDLRPVYEQTPWRVTMPQDLILGGACHPIDLLRWFMGDISEVHCYGLRSGVSLDYPQEDTFVINVKFASGKIGRRRQLPRRHTHPRRPHEQPLRVRNQRHYPRQQDTPRRRRVAPPTNLLHRVPSGGRSPGEMMVMLQHMADCVLNGVTPWVGAREGARVVSTGLACWDSLRSGVPAQVRNEF